MLSNYLAEEYFEKIKPEVNLVSSFLEDPLIKEILVLCRLKPYKYNTQFNRKLILRRHWVDEFGNSLIITKKELKIIEGDLSLDGGVIKFTDLYFGLGVDKISKISSKLYFLDGIDELGAKYAVLAFWGMDGYLRTFLWMGAKVERVSPLLLGIKTLKTIVENKDINFFKKVDSKEKVILPCAEKREWIVSLPLQDFSLRESGIDKQLLNNLGVY